MTQHALRTAGLTLTLLLAAAEARGQQAPFQNPAPVLAAQGPVPDPVFRAVVGRKVELRLLDGQLAQGQLLTLEAENAVLALPDGRVTMVPRAQILEVRLASGTAATPAIVLDLPKAQKAADIPSAPVNRYFGVQFGLGPGVLALDLAYGNFYGFLSGSLALPLYTAGTNTNAVGGFTLAPGVSFKLADDRNWNFDLFVHASLGYFGHGGYYYGPAWTTVDGSVGLGMGFHYTAANGFTLGFKAPIVGFAFGGDVSDLKSAGGYYYLNSVVSFPMATVGYRF